MRTDISHSRPSPSFRLLPCFLLWLCTSIHPAIAQDAAGNYTVENYPTDAENTDYAQRYWQVVVKQLNCRKSPGTQQPIVGVFQRGDRITAVTSRGSQDNLPNDAFLKLDDQGKTWLYVGEFQGCFVRANRALIAPDMTPHD